MLTPLNGFKKFGYDLAENQTVFFMIHRFGDNIIYKYYVAAAVMMIVGMVICLRREGVKAMPMVLLGVFYHNSYFQGGAFDHAVRISFYPVGRVFLCAVYQKSSGGVLSWRL